MPNKKTNEHVHVTATGRDVTNINTDKRTEARGRDKVAVDGALAPANDIPTRGTAEQELSPFDLLPLFLHLLLRFRCRHFPFTPARATVESFRKSGKKNKKKMKNDRSNG